MSKHKHKLITLGILTVAATGVIHVLNQTVAASAVRKNKLPVLERKYYHWRFGDIYYEKKGSGSPLLLVHDLTPASSGAEWKKTERLLAKHHTVYTLDLLGCGRSDKPNITYTNFIYVQLLCDFIKNVIAEKADIIASGFSGSFAVMACHNEPSLFQKLMLVNPPSLASLKQSPGKRSRLLKFLLEAPIFGTMLYHMITSQENLRNTLMEQYYYNPFHVTDDLVDTYYESAHISSGDAKFLYASLASCYLNLNISHALKSIDHSIMIVEGEKDADTAEDYIQLNPAVETFRIPRTKHLPQLEAAVDFAEQAEIFFN